MQRFYALRSKRTHRLKPVVFSYNKKIPRLTPEDFCMYLIYTRDTLVAFGPFGLSLTSN